MPTIICCHCWEAPRPDVPDSVPVHHVCVRECEEYARYHVGGGPCVCSCGLVLLERRQPLVPPYICQLCKEPMAELYDNHQSHRECMLHDVTGGIGHLIAHEYWCVQHHDPDAGLTYRQSALLVDEFVVVVGVDEALSRGRDEG